MESAEHERAPYVVPRYRDEGDPAWYHVLHGTVPGHQIDFMYCPHVPQGRLTQTHFGHLARLIKYIEPRRGAPFAFALGNLSRDDVQHEAGHGGVALIFALRVAGVTDHAGRDMPPYAHGVLAIDRALDYGTLLDAISVFYRRFLDSDPRVQDATGSFYRSYVRAMEERPEAVDQFLHDYVTDFDELPQPARSSLGWDWEADEAALPKRVTIVHADDEPFSNIAHAAALLGAMLYKSNIKWTAVTSGEVEVSGGITIRLVPESEAPRNPTGIVIPLRDLPGKEEDLATKVFGAKPREVEIKVTRAGWREALGAQKVEEASAAVAAAGMARQPSTRPPPPSVKPPVPSTPPSAPPGPGTSELDEAATIPVALEADPEAPAFDPRRSSPSTGVAGAFDPRRSSPTTGVAGAFDPRRSSPTTGVAAASVKSTPSPANPRVASGPPPAIATPEDIRISEPPPPPRPRIGLWIGVLGGLAVVVAIAVALAGGSSGEESSSGSGMTTTATPGSTGAPSAPASALETPTSVAPSTAPTTTAAPGDTTSREPGTSGTTTAATATPVRTGGSAPPSSAPPGTSPAATSVKTATSSGGTPAPTPNGRHIGGPLRRH